MATFGITPTYIEDYTYKYVYSWLDNDAAGLEHRAILNDFIYCHKDLVHVALNKKYSDHKDVNAWLMHDLKLTV